MSAIPRRFRGACRALAAALLLLTLTGCGSGKQQQSNQPPSGIGQLRSGPALPPAPAFKARAEALHQTVVTAHLREPHVPGKNILWCATMQMAWDEAAKHFGGTMPLAGAPLMQTVLDEHLVTAADLDPDSYVALGGFRRDGIARKINDAIAGKFGAGHAPTLLPSGGAPANLLAYAYLFKQIEFAAALAPNVGDPLQFKAATPVRSYGLWSDAQLEDWNAAARQIQILHYVDDNDFIVEIVTRSKVDRVILAKIAPGKTLIDDIHQVMPAVNGGTSETFIRCDILLVPTMDFDLQRTYSEILGQRVQKPCVDAPDEEKSYEFGAAEQTIELKLDEHGAVVKSEAYLEMMPTPAPDPDYVPPPPPKPKYLICDQPFLLLLLRKDADMPYLALWIDNPELLQPAK